jgi:hypothetical protein
MPSNEFLLLELLLSRIFINVHFINNFLAVVLDINITRWQIEKNEDSRGSLEFWDLHITEIRFGANDAIGILVNKIEAVCVMLIKYFDDFLVNLLHMIHVEGWLEKPSGHPVPPRHCKLLLQLTLILFSRAMAFSNCSIFPILLCVAGVDVSSNVQVLFPKASCSTTRPNRSINVMNQP